MSAASQLLTASCVRQLSRSASGIVAKVGRGFQVLRIDGYSWTQSLPGGHGVSSQVFTVGGRHWCIDYYPNGADASVDDSDAIALFLRLHSARSHNSKERVRAQYKFGLLDAAGVDAYEQCPTTNVFMDGQAFGYRAFIAKEELERRRESLLQDDCLAVRCDVGVVQLETLAVAPKENSGRHDDDDDDGERRRPRPPLDDTEYVRRSLAKHRR
ncbi:hypothetical protein ACP70R_003034 [Stipagrostis hirtigluma subsp. patula]